MKKKGFIDGLEAIKVIEKVKRDGFSYVDFSEYSLCYKFSNENLSGYYPKFNIKDGNVLTVCGSGDQVLSALLYGATSVDCFDTNILTYYNLMLKAYSIKYLSFEDFFSFFGLSHPCDKKSFYDSFKDKIDNEDVRIFFDLLFDNNVNINYLYNNSDCYSEDLVLSIPYLNVESYYKLRDLIDISKINFTVCDLFDIYKQYDNKYDFINLSNICDYINNLIPFYSFINDTHLNHLNVDGGVMVGYAWTRPHFNETNEMIASIVGASQDCIDGVGHYCDGDYDSIMYVKKRKS